MKILLDTDALLFVATEPEALSGDAAAAILSRANEVLVSAASAWEIATKVRIGKLPQATFFEAKFVAETTKAGYLLLPISVQTALSSGRMAGAHRDPFDRMIAAQALELDVPIVSSDRKLDDFGVRRIW